MTNVHNSGQCSTLVTTKTIVCSCNIVEQKFGNFVKQPFILECLYIRETFIQLMPNVTENNQIQVDGVGRNMIICKISHVILKCYWSFPSGCCYFSSNISLLSSSVVSSFLRIFV